MNQRVVIAVGLALLMAASGMAQEQPATSGSPEDSQGLEAQEQAARTEATLALAKLELVLARKGLRDERHADAARKALRVLELLKQLPTQMDVGEYELQAEGVLSRTSKAGLNVEALRRDADLYAEAKLPPRASDPSPDAKPREAEPGAYQTALERAYRDSEVRLLVEADEARVVGDGVVSYPPDWPEKMKKRAQYRGGLIARTPSWIDKDGREWYIAVYDIRDLIYVPPDFTGIQFNPIFADRDAQDRAALRWGSQIFRGWPDDLAAGIPLLRYFGGVDDTAYRGPKYSVERQNQIAELIKAFVGPHDGEPKVVPLSP